MKDWSIFSKLDHNGAYLPKFPIDSPLSHQIGLGLISQVGNLVECSFQHPRHICATGSGAVQEAFSSFNKFAGASISGFLEHRIPSYSKGYQLPQAQVQELAGHT
jgi:hypothetical protein